MFDPFWKNSMRLPLRYFVRIPTTLTVSALALMVFFVPGLNDWMQLDRDAIANGQVWRLWTGHLTHFGGDHLVWDLLMFVVLGIACEWRRWQTFLCWIWVSLPMVSGMILWCCPEIVIYRGLSGIDTGLFVWFCGAQVTDHLTQQRKVFAMGYAVLLIALIGKMMYEYLTGACLFVETVSFHPLLEAHLIGAVVGLPGGVPFKPMRFRFGSDQAGKGALKRLGTNRSIQSKKSCAFNDAGDHRKTSDLREEPSAISETTIVFPD